MTLKCVTSNLITQDHKAISSKSGLPVQATACVRVCVWEWEYTRASLVLTLTCLSYCWCMLKDAQYHTGIAKADNKRALLNSAPVSSPYPGLEYTGRVFKSNPPLSISHSITQKLTGFLLLCWLLCTRIHLQCANSSSGKLWCPKANDK